MDRVFAEGGKIGERRGFVIKREILSKDDILLD